MSVDQVGTEDFGLKNILDVLCFFFAKFSSSAILVDSKIQTGKGSKSKHDGVIMSHWMFVQERMLDGGILPTHKHNCLKIVSEVN